MPTGYTCDVQSGKVTEFREFAMQCARAFGACIDMRDDANDAPIPSRFEPRTGHYDQVIEEAAAKVRTLEAMTDAQCEDASFSDYATALRQHEEREREREAQRERYEAMLKQVKQWEAPSPEHEPLKEFMVQQLSESMRFDCQGYGSKPYKASGDAWRAQQLDYARRRLANAKQDRVQEIHRVESRNLWLQSLRASLEPTNV